MATRSARRRILSEKGLPLRSKTSCCTDGPWRCRGQATIEAAVLLPSVMLLFAILLEPACLSYTRTIMRATACETARVAATDYDGDLDDCKGFALRRLAAVPEVPLFHVGGKADWQVDIERGEHEVKVAIRGHARPLPLMGVVASALGESDGEGVVPRVEVSEKVRPDWLGGSYESWQQIWG